MRKVILTYVVVILVLHAEDSRAENYAILFSGGVDETSNWARYYNTTNWMHEVLVEEFNYLPENVYVLAADGLDTFEDRQVGNSAGSGTINSDWTDVLARGSTVQSATRANIQSTIASMGMTSRDTFLFWSFDHGDGDTDPAVFHEEALRGWGEDIAATVFPTDMAAVEAQRQAYVFAQCFSGGMLDELDMAVGRFRYGCASTNHYETSKWYPGPPPGETASGFAEAFYDGMEAYYSETHALFDYAVSHAPNCFEGQNDGTTGAARQNPWDVGDNFDLAVSSWTGTSDGDWNNTYNWANSYIPEPTRTVRIGDTRPCTVDQPNSCYSVVMLSGTELHLAAGGQLDIGGDIENNNGNIRLSDGTLNVTYQAINLGSTSKIGIGLSAEMTAGELENEGQVNVAGTLDIAGDGLNRNQMLVHGTGDMIVGGNLTVSPSAELNIEGNGSIATVELDIENDGDINITQRGTLWVWDDLNVGVSDAAAVSVNDAYLQVNHQMLVGIGADGSLGCELGEVTISNLLSIGDTANAGFEVLGTQVTAEYLVVGRGPGTYGLMLVDVGGSFNTIPTIELDGNRRIKIGAAGTGEVVHYNGNVTRADIDGDYPTIILGEDQEAVGTYKMHEGSIHAHDLKVGENGTGTFEQSGGTVTVDNFLYFGGDSSRKCAYSLNDGTLEVNSVTKGLSSHGQLEINGGTFDLTGPSINVYRLQVASLSGQNADLKLAGKYVSTDYLQIGQSGTSGRGTYEFNGGTTIAANELSIGHTGDGLMTQIAGATEASNLFIGHGTDAEGTYDLNDGTLDVTNTISVGQYGIGRFNVNGPTVVVNTQDLAIGHYIPGSVLELAAGEIYATGTLELGTLSSSAGTLRQHKGKISSGETIVGHQGEGTVEQFGGLHEVAATLTVGKAGDGNYYLRDGKLETDCTVVGESATGYFLQELGIHHATGDMYLGYGGGGDGTYEMTGGFLTVEGNMFIGYTGDSGLLSIAAAEINDAGGLGNLHIESTGQLTGHGVVNKPIQNLGTLQATGGVLTLLQTYGGTGAIDIASGATLQFADNCLVDTDPNNDGVLSVKAGITQLLGQIPSTSSGDVVVKLGGTLQFARSINAGDLVCSGLVEQSGGTASLAATLKVGGEYRMDDPAARLSVPTARIEGLFDQQSGFHQSDTVYIGESGGKAVYEVGDARLSTDTLHLGLLHDGTEAPGELNLSDAKSVVVVSDSYTLYSQGVLSAVPGAHFIFTGSSFSNYSTNPNNARGFNDLTVIFEGGNGHIDPFDVAADTRIHAGDLEGIDVAVAALEYHG